MQLISMDRASRPRGDAAPRHLNCVRGRASGVLGTRCRRLGSGSAHGRSGRRAAAGRRAIRTGPAAACVKSSGDALTARIHATGDVACGLDALLLSLEGAAWLVGSSLRWARPLLCASKQQRRDGNNASRLSRRLFPRRLFPRRRGPRRRGPSVRRDCGIARSRRGPPAIGARRGTRGVSVAYRADTRPTPSVGKRGASANLL